MDLFELVGRISIQGTADATRQINTVTGTAQQSSGIFGTVGTKIAAAVGAAFATQKIVAFGKDVMQTTMTFSDSMLKVQSLSGATGNELQQLRDTALDWGSKTAWSASQVADAMGYMALAGFDTNEIMSATPGILGLASASGTDLARSSDILTDALTAFGYAAQDAALFADVLATTQAKTNTTVDALGEAFKYAGTVAGTYKYSVEDVSAALGLMANAGVKGSMAGTAFSSIITRLGTNTRGARDMLESLGIEFYNADGTARDLSLVMMELADATKDLDVAQKSEIAKTIAGAEAQKGLLAILNQGSEAYAELKKQLNNCAGAASDMSGTMESGIGGAIRTVQSALEGFKIKLGEKFEPYVTEVLQKLAAFVTNTLVPTMESVIDRLGDLKQWGEEHSQTIQNIISLVEVLTAAMIGFKAGAMIQGVVTAFQSAQVALALYSATANGATIAQGFLNGTLTIGETIVALLTGKITLAELATALWTKAQIGLNAVMSANPIGLVVAAIAAVIAILVIAYNKSETFRNFVDGLWAKIKDVAVKIPPMLQQMWETIKTVFTNGWNVIVTFFTHSVPQFIDNIVKWFKNLPNEISTFINETSTKIETWAKDTADKAKEAGTNFLKNVVTFFKELPHNVGYLLGYVTGTIANFGRNTAIKAQEIGSQFLENVTTFFRELPGRIFLFITTTYNNVVNWTEEMKLKAIETGTEFLTNIVNFFIQLPGKVSEFITNTYNNITTWGINVKNKAIETGKNFINNIVNFFQQLPGKVQSFLTNTINNIINFVNNMINKAREGANNFVNTITSTLQTLPSKVTSIGKSIVEGLWNGITSMGNWLRNQITSFANGIIDGFKSAFDINSPSKKMMVIGEFVDEGLGVGLTGSDASVDAVQDKFGKVMNVAKSSLKGVHNLITNEPLPNISLNTGVNKEIAESPMQKYQVEFNAQFNALNNGFERLIGLINDYLPDIANNSQKQIVLDTGALAVGMSRQIDRQLGKISSAKGRGNV